MFTVKEHSVALAILKKSLLHCARVFIPNMRKFMFVIVVQFYNKTLVQINTLILINNIYIIYNNVK